MGAPGHFGPARFYGRAISAGKHMCCLYDDDSERFEIIAKFIASGLQEHEKL